MVGSWSYSFTNWVYVVLSRVKSLNGLFLCKPISMDKEFKVDDDLIAFERRMEFLQGSVLQKMDLGDAPSDDENSESDEDYDTDCNQVKHY